MNISNGIYKATVWDNGRFTACTDAAHPYWPNENILCWGVSGAGQTSYNTIRSLTSHSDYVLSTVPWTTDPGYTIINTGPASNTVLSGSSIQTTIILTKPQYPDDLTIVQTIALHGTTVFDSAIEITVSVSNTGSEPVLIGVRYWLDFMLDGDDRTSFQQKSPEGDVLSKERTFSPVPFQYYQMKNVTGSPVMYIMGTTLGPSALVPVPTPPDQLEFTNTIAANHSFTYGTSDRPITDGCVLYYWGNQGEIEVAPSGSTTVTALLFEKQGSRGIPFLP